MGSGELRVASGTSKLMEGKFSYNVAGWKPVVDYRAGGTSTGELKLSQPNSSGSSFGNAVNNWDVKLNDGLPLEITANLGAGEANLDLGKMNLNRVEMEPRCGQSGYGSARRAEARLHGPGSRWRRRDGRPPARETSASRRRRAKASATSASKASRSADRRLGKSRSHRRAGDGSARREGRGWADPVDSLISLNAPESASSEQETRRPEEVFF